MSDNTIRHLVASLATLASIFIYFEGYFSGVRGWWFTVITLIGVYAIIYKLVNV